MNERIRLLALQAGATTTQRSGWIDYGTLDLDVEKFAELIVRKCADVAKETRWAVPPSQEQIARGIQQHFGVDE
jgi:hypothetical protein